ncbi:axin isoform X2 [Bradysia coprophila]|uniref:axin isoform X2 n=1 Tax=Bradysia coprophila TaxID=38358 RepID=UPI00187D88BA|nr:axin isoform X2 [Bradysia coprophila]
MNRGVRPKYIDEYECNGPRPPVPGQESRMSRMTESDTDGRSHRTSVASFSKWNTLTGLLEDEEGLTLFKKYVERDARPEHSARLDFYFVCEGLKQYKDDPRLARKCISLIYRTYIQKGPIQISISKIDSNFKQKYDAIRNEENPPDIQIFDLLQQEAFRLLNKSAFQNFLQSDDYIAHIANATGSGAGCTSTSSSSGSNSAQLPRSALPTVVEDQELSINRDEILHTGEGTPMRLTRELLLLSQQRRLEARPPADGRSHGHGHGHPTQVSNKETLTKSTHIPRTQRVPLPTATNPNSVEFITKLREKLEALQRQRQMPHQLNIPDPSDNLPRPSKNQLNLHDLTKKLQLEEDNDQSILDQHVSRVWSDLTPHRSPGTISPCPPVPNRRRTHDPVITGVDAGQSMRHSKSMPDHASSSRRLTHKWASMNTDSGISLFSADTTLRSRDSNSRSRSGVDPITISTVEEASRRLLEDESRRSRRHSQHPPQPRQMAALSESTIAVYTYLDEELPYRSKLPGLQPTLRLFKEYLPKKGNFRFFFKTTCDDSENPIIQEEIVNEDEILPLFEGKVMGLVKPYE